MGTKAPFPSLLQGPWLDNLSTLHELQFRARLNDQQAADLCGVSLRTWYRWLKIDSPQPAALRLMTILAGHVPWAGWDGWEMHSGYLFPPGYSRNGLSSGHILARHFEQQLLAHYKRENHQLREEVEALKARWQRQAVALCLRALPIKIFI